MRLSLATGSSRAAALITTYNTFVTDRFHAILGRFPQKKVLIADEVHHLGAQNRRIELDAFEKRLGLSATPRRMFDPSGTAWLLENVGDVVFRFEMKDAIPKYLVPYYYYVHIVRLDYAEQADYQEVSAAISRACAQGATLSEEDPEENARLGPLLRRRHEIIGGAKGKIEQLRQVLRDGTWQRGNGLNFSLFYASSSLFDELLRLTSTEFGLKVSKFTFEESMPERRQILDDFSQQRIDAIIAKKCLDEGMDIPATRNAFILASSSNPMEFVQRRGRVLRQHANKNEAIIHDFFVLPAEGYRLNEYDRRLVGRELRRALEFSRTAKNHVACARQLLPIQEKYNLLDVD
jgi:superfamily II DNA or RNA helicase